eukprot:30846-Pelagococcus_subviridis.AAC.2
MRPRNPKSCSVGPGRAAANPVRVPPVPAGADPTTSPPRPPNPASRAATCASIATPPPPPPPPPFVPFPVPVPVPPSSSDALRCALYLSRHASCASSSPPTKSIFANERLDTSVECEFGGWTPKRRLFSRPGGAAMDAPTEDASGNRAGPISEERPFGDGGLSLFSVVIVVRVMIFFRDATAFPPSRPSPRASRARASTERARVRARGIDVRSDVPRQSRGVVRSALRAASRCRVSSGAAFFFICRKIGSPGCISIRAILHRYLERGRDQVLKPRDG